MRRQLAAFLILSSLAAGPAFAQAPRTLAYQGRLVSSDGTPMTGTARLTFSIHAAPSGGSALWSEAHNVGFTDGFYAVYLGGLSALPAALFDGSDRYLEITVGTETLAPRQRMVSAPYALSAGVARDLAGGTVDATSLTVGGQQLVDGSGQLRPEAATAFAQKSELRTSGALNQSTNPVDWTRLKSVPAGFADGQDDVGLTSMSASAPLVSSGGASPNLSLPRASASSDGYLASSDFASFSGKVASVSAGTGVTVGGTPAAPSVSVNYGTTSVTAARGDDPRLADARAPTGGSNLYIQNQTGSAQQGGFSVAGNGTVGGNLAVNGDSRLGTGGWSFTAIKSYTVSWNPPATPNVTTASHDVNLPEPGIVIGVSTPQVGLNCGGYGCYLAAGFSFENAGGNNSFRLNNEATERVRLNFVNLSGATADPPAGTWRIVYIQP